MLAVYNVKVSQERIMLSKQNVVFKMTILWTTTFATTPDPNPEFGLEILLPFPDSHNRAVSTPDSLILLP